MKNYRILFLLIILCLTSITYGGTMKKSIGLSNKAHTLSEEQIRFCAQNFDEILIGQWPEDIAKAEEFKIINPNVKLLGYVSFRTLIPDSARFLECDGDETLFAHDPQGERITTISFENYLMDIYNPDWAAKLIQWANEFPSWFDGIFLDVAQPTLLENDYVVLPDGYDADAYAIQSASVMDALCAAYPGMVVYNGLKSGLNQEGYSDNTDGGLMEGFIFSRSSQAVDVQKFYNYCNALLKAGRGNLIASACVKTYKGNIQNRMFAVACYLLGANNLSRYNVVDIDTEHSDPLQYYPEYKIWFKNPIDMPETIDDLLKPNNLVVRRFKEGVVIVNPWDYDIDIPLVDGKYRKLTLSGGGVVSESGKCKNSLRSKRVGGITTIPAESAMILIRYYLNKLPGTRPITRFADVEVTK